MKMNLRQMILRFMDWSPETVQITPAPEAQTEAAQAGAKSPKTKLSPLWRLATIANPKTGKAVVLDVRVDGRLFRGDAARLGVTQASEWHQVRAPSRAEAKKLIAAGKAERRTAS
jgi:hypothetical protein